MVLRLAILVIGLVAVYVIFFSGSEDKDMMDETNTMPKATMEKMVKQPAKKPAAKSSPSVSRPSTSSQSMSNESMSKEQETRQLLDELRAIPVSQYAANLSRYQRLLELHPRDETFMRKVEFYSDKLRSQQAGY